MLVLLRFPAATAVGAAANARVHRTVAAIALLLPPGCCCSVDVDLVHAEGVVILIAGVVVALALIMLVDVVCVAIAMSVVIVLAVLFLSVLLLVSFLVLLLLMLTTGGCWCRCFGCCCG